MEEQNPLFKEIKGLKNWIKCLKCDVNVTLKDAETLGCPSCKTLYKKTDNERAEEKIELSKYLSSFQIKLLMRDILPISKIEEKLFVGNAVAASSFNILKNNGITHIINVCFELPCFFPTLFKYLHLRLKDEREENFYNQFKQICEFVDEEERRNEKSKFLFHCVQGQSRSVTALMCVLIHRSPGKRVEEILEQVERKKPNASPNQTFIKQLEEWSLKLD